MSKKKAVSTSRKQQRSAGVQWNFPLTKSNFLYFGAALGVIVIGYLL